MKNNEFLEEIKKLPNKNVIYGLYDPITDEVRYVGKAVNLYNRIKNHYKNSRLIIETHKNNWLNKLLKNGLYVNVKIIELCDDESQLNDCEIKWINYYKLIGCDLTNGTNGGDGGRMSEDSIKKMILTKTGKKLTEEHKLKISESKKGHSVSEDTRKKLIEKRKLYKVSEESRKKMSESHKGKPSWNKGLKATEETKEKMRQSRLNYLKKNSLI